MRNNAMIDTSEVLTVQDLMNVLRDMPETCLVNIEITNSLDGNRIIRCPAYLVVSSRYYGKSEDNEFITIGGIKE